MGLVRAAEWGQPLKPAYAPTPLWAARAGTLPFVLRQTVKLGLNRIGLERKSGQHDRHVQRQMLLRGLSISTVLDAGANEGVYGTRLRGWGGHYAGQIVSFEPVHEAFERLRAISSSDAKWNVCPWALSDRTGQNVIHVPLGHSDLSSLEEMTSAGRHLAQDAPIIDQQIEVKRLDDVIDQVVEPGGRVALKLDVQGHERQLLDGAARTLDRIVMIECEMPLVAMYAGIESFSELLMHITARGFRPVGMWSNYVVPRDRICTGRRCLFCPYDGLVCRTARRAVRKRCGPISARAGRPRTCCRLALFP